MIELLVVIAIIAILASLLLPTLWWAKEAGRTAVCKSNLRQWGMGVRMYLDDFGVYPPYLMSDIAGGPTNAWSSRLQRYTGTQLHPGGGSRSGSKASFRNDGSGSIEVCPSYARMNGVPPLDGPWPSNDIKNYGYNVDGFWRPSGQKLGLGGDFKHNDFTYAAYLGTVRVIGEAEVQCPSDMIAIGDARLWGWQVAEGFGPWAFAGGDRLSVPWPDYVGLLALGLKRPMVESDLYFLRSWKIRHAGRFNVVFCDGHVEGLSFKQLFDPRDDKVVKRWNRDNQPHRETIYGQY